MNRVAVFAHFDIKNRVDDYVLYYLKELKKICSKIIFVSSCELPKEELEKVTKYAIAILEKHNEYDFGSYKRGFFYAKNNGLLEKIDELIFANDSCYGPFKPLENIFALMEDSCADFWGLSKNKYGFKKKINKLFYCVSPHIQTYFIVFRANVFNSEDFEQFMSNIKEEKEKNEIIFKYEVGLTQFLEQKGYKSDFYLKEYYNCNNPVIYQWRRILTHTNFPFVKCSLLRLNNSFHTTIVGWKEVLALYYYPKGLVEKNLEYTIRKKSLQEKVPNNLKISIFNTISELEPQLRRVVALFLKNCFPAIMD